MMLKGMPHRESSAHGEIQVSRRATAKIRQGLQRAADFAQRRLTSVTKTTDQKTRTRNAADTHQKGKKEGMTTMMSRILIDLTRERTEEHQSQVEILKLTTMTRKEEG